MFYLKEINNKDYWEGFLLNCKEKTFLHSWNWGEFQKRLGNKIWRFGFFKDSDLISLILVIKIIAKRGTFFLIPHGPVIKEESATYETKIALLKTILEKLKEINKFEKCIFLRISPIWERSKENQEIFKKFGFLEAPIFSHPEISLELDISLSEEDLLMNMRKTTRYLIKKAQKIKNLEVEKNGDLRKIEKFYEIYQNTAERHSFFPFSLEYLKNEFLAFSPDHQISIFFTKYSPSHSLEEKEIISGGIFIFWQEKGFYHHGASTLKYPKIPVSYLLLWEAIREAKKRGCSFFNFWGISPLEKKSHPWYGLSLFKMGFGGEIKKYLKTKDYPFSKKYWLVYIFEALRRHKRRV